MFSNKHKIAAGTSHDQLLKVLLWLQSGYNSIKPFFIAISHYNSKSFESFDSPIAECLHIATDEENFLQASIAELKQRQGVLHDWRENFKYGLVSAESSRIKPIYDAHGKPKKFYNEDTGHQLTLEQAEKGIGYISPDGVKHYLYSNVSNPIGTLWEQRNLLASVSHMHELSVDNSVILQNLIPLWMILSKIIGGFSLTRQLNLAAHAEQIKCITTNIITTVNIRCDNDAIAFNDFLVFWYQEIFGSSEHRLPQNLVNSVNMKVAAAIPPNSPQKTLATWPPNSSRAQPVLGRSVSLDEGLHNSGNDLNPAPDSALGASCESLVTASTYTKVQGDSSTASINDGSTKTASLQSSALANAATVLLAPNQCATPIDTEEWQAPIVLMRVSDVHAWEKAQYISHRAIYLEENIAESVLAFNTMLQATQVSSELRKEYQECFDSLFLGKGSIDSKKIDGFLAKKLSRQSAAEVDVKFLLVLKNILTTTYYCRNHILKFTNAVEQNIANRNGRQSTSYLLTTQGIKRSHFDEPLRMLEPDKLTYLKQRLQTMQRNQLEGLRFKKLIKVEDYNVTWEMQDRLKEIDTYSKRENSLQQLKSQEEAKGFFSRKQKIITDCSNELRTVKINKEKAKEIYDQLRAKLREYEDRATLYAADVGMIAAIRLVIEEDFVRLDKQKALFEDQWRQGIEGLDKTQARFNPGDRDTGYYCQFEGGLAHEILSQAWQETEILAARKLYIIAIEDLGRAIKDYLSLTSGQIKQQWLQSQFIDLLQRSYAISVV